MEEHAAIEKLAAAARAPSRPNMDGRDNSSQPQLAVKVPEDQWQSDHTDEATPPPPPPPDSATPTHIQQTPDTPLPEGPAPSEEALAAAAGQHGTHRAPAPSSSASHRTPASKQKQAGRTISRALPGKSAIVKAVSSAALDMDLLRQFNTAWMSWNERDGNRTPFHRLCANPRVTASHVAVISDGLRMARAASRTDSNGRLPLHIACSNKAASAAFIEAVANLDPTALTTQSHNGSTPLHEACRLVAKPTILTSLCKLAPRTLECRDERNQLPLHVLCGAGKDADLNEIKVAALSAAVEQHVGPLLALEVDADGATPLHLLCANANATPEMVLVIGGLAPGAAKLKAGPSLSLDALRHPGGRPRRSSRTEDSEDKGDAANARERRKSGSRFRASSSGQSFLGEMLGSRLGFKFAVSSLVFGSDRRRNNDDAGLLPLHVACARPHKASVDLLKAVARLWPDAAKQRTDQNLRLALHVLALNDVSATPGNWAVLTALYPEGADARDKFDARPVDLMARYVIERYAPQLLTMMPKMALERPGGCQHCLLHYACCVDSETTEQVVATLYEQLHTSPPLAVYLQLPELSRERLASTSVVVNLVDKIFTAPSIVAYLMWEVVTCLVLVLAFFRLCHDATAHPNLYFDNSRRLAVVGAGSSVHIVHIILTRILYLSKLSKHHKVHYFLTTWNLVDLATVVMWGATVITLQVGRARDFRIVAAIAQIVVPVRFLKLVKGLNQHIGAFVLCLMNVFRAILPFCAVLALVLFSFANSFETLLGHKSNHDMGEIDSNGEIGGVDNEFSTIGKSLFAVIRIGLIGDLEPDFFKDTEAAVIVLVLFIVIVAIVLLNMLIAVVSDSYEATLTNSEAIYLRSRLESAAEMQSMFPPSMFEPTNSALLIFVSCLLFPFTAIWVCVVTVTRFFQGSNSAQQMHPRRLLAYARPPEEEEDSAGQRAKQTSREKVLEQSMLKALAKLQADLEERMQHAHDNVSERLVKVETTLNALATDKTFKEALANQNKHLDILINRLQNAPVAALPNDVVARLDAIEEAIEGVNQDDLALDAYDVLLNPCLAPSRPSRHDDDDELASCACLAPPSVYSHFGS